MYCQLLRPGSVADAETCAAAGKSAVISHEAVERKRKKGTPIYKYEAGYNSREEAEAAHPEGFVKEIGRRVGKGKNNVQWALPPW